MDDAELRALLAAQSRLIAELSERLAPMRATVRLADLFARYEVAQKQLVTARYMLRPIVALMPDRDAASLTAADWTAYRVTRDDLAPSSLNLALRCLKALLRWGKREGLLAAVPQLCEARKQTQKKHRETAPTVTDVGKLLNDADRDRDRVIVLCAFDSSMRNTEIRKLEWSWIDRAKMVIHLPGAITKSKKSRDVPMTERQLRAIDAIPRDIRSPLVLRSPRGGGAYSKSHMSVMFRALNDLTGLAAAPGDTRVHLHDIRHAGATYLAELGVRIEVIQEILGHSSLDQTKDYVQRRSGDLGAARDILERGIKRDSR